VSDQTAPKFIAVFEKLVRTNPGRAEQSAPKSEAQAADSRRKIAGSKGALGQTAATEGGKG